jgi:hypothetical protein
MRGLTEAVAFAGPDYGELRATADAVNEARHGKRAIEIRIGVGPLTGEIPLRVLGHAACIAATLRTDLPAAIKPADRVCIFSSAPKTGNANMGAVLQSLAALAGALRLAGVLSPIMLDIACAAQEVPSQISVDLPETLLKWLTEAGGNAGNRADPAWYAIEHSAPSMFADLAGPGNVPVRVTVGSAPEARFWAARRRVRAAAMMQGLRLSPAIGLIMRSLLRPWYSNTTAEPALSDALASPSSAMATLDRAANPQHKGGNSGLKREARATRRMLALSNVNSFIEAVSNARTAAQYIRDSEFGIGARLALELEVI